MSGESRPEAAHAQRSVNGTQTRGGANAPLARQAVGGRLVTLTRADSVQPDRVSWAWRGRIPLGSLTVLAGQQGLGKSTLGCELAAQASTGRLEGDLLGLPSDVLLVTLEDHLATVVVPRLMAAGADLSRIHFVRVQIDQTTGLLNLPGDLPAVEREIGTHGARLLVVDPVVATLPSSIDAHRDQHVRLALAPLASLAERLDLAVIAVMHLNKRDTSDLLARVSGSIAFTAAARSVLAFARDPNDPDPDSGYERVIVHAKCNVAKLAPALACRIESRTLPGPNPIETSRIVILGACGVTASDLARHNPDAHAEIDHARDFLGDELADGQPHPVSEVVAAAKAVGISERTLYRAANGLAVVRQRSGFPARATWQLPVLPAESSDRSADGWQDSEKPTTTGDGAEAQQQFCRARAHGKTEATTPSPCGHEKHRPSDWRSVSGQVVCGVCHPPAAPELVLLVNDSPNENGGRE